MEWNEIVLPDKQFVGNDPWRIVKEYYDPEVVQDILNEHGVQGAVRLINEHTKMRYNRMSLLLQNKDGQKVLTNYCNSRTFGV